MYCDHKFIEDVEPEEWPTLENGWYLRCEWCGKWAIQPTEWFDDQERPVGELIILTPKGWMGE